MPFDFSRSVFKVVDGLNDILQSVKLLLLVELEQDHLPVQFEHLLAPVLKLFALDARSVTRWSGVGQAFHLNQLRPRVAKQPSWPEIFESGHI